MNHNEHFSGQPTPLFRILFGDRLRALRSLLRDVEWCSRIRTVWARGPDSERECCPICSATMNEDNVHGKHCRLNQMIEFFGRL